MTRFTFLFLSLALLSVSLNGVLLYSYLNDFYYVRYYPKLLGNTEVLGSLLNEDMTLTYVSDRIESQFPNLEKRLREDHPSMWTFGEGPTYEIALEAGGLTFFFHENETLARVDHWLYEKSPLFFANQ
ncbi:MAG: hypothetical protein U5L08_00800 [Xanthomonadales bacterium]|nr:hypothetical protein [Xanthomonadales bacterium]